MPKQPKIWIISVVPILICLLVTVPFVCLSVTGKIEINSSDWMTFIGALLSFAGTSILGLTAYLQTKYINQQARLHAFKLNINIPKQEIIIKKYNGEVSAVDLIQDKVDIGGIVGLRLKYKLFSGIQPNCYSLRSANLELPPLANYTDVAHFAFNPQLRKRLIGFVDPTENGYNTLRIEMYVCKDIVDSLKSIMGRLLEKHNNDEVTQKELMLLTNTLNLTLNIDFIYADIKVPVQCIISGSIILENNDLCLNIRETTCTSLPSEFLEY